MPQPRHEGEARAILGNAELATLVGMSFYVAAIAIMLAYPDVNAIR